MPDYAVIIPTYNESGNVSELSKRLTALLTNFDYELIFVDDNSKDGTLDELYTLAKNNTRIRYIRRVGRRGLASACVEGMLSTTATYLAVIDSDLQHDETKLPEMFNLLQKNEANIVVASRHIEEGGMGNWNQTRIGISNIATVLAKHCMTVPCSDPMSGFFALHRTLIDTAAPEIQGRGFKILFDILTQSKLVLQVREISYVFKERQVGTTKLGISVIYDFLRLLLSKYFTKLIHIEFILFCLVGLTGVLVHLGSLFIIHKVIGSSFFVGQCLATMFAMISNYTCNNMVTFQSQQLKGLEFIIGCGKFCLACTVGAFVNIAVSNFLHEYEILWSISAIGGVVAGSLINFFFARNFIWRDKD